MLARHHSLAVTLSAPFALCGDGDIIWLRHLPLQWVNSKEYLGAAASTKRPTSCVMIAQARARRKTETQDAKTQQDETEFQSTFSDVHKEVSDLVSPRAHRLRANKSTDVASMHRTRQSCTRPVRQPLSAGHACLGYVIMCRCTLFLSSD